MRKRTILLGALALSTATVAGAAPAGNREQPSRPSVIGPKNLVLKIGSLFASAQVFYAVVDNNALVRGANVTGVAHPGTGNYTVGFPHNVSKCAYVATLGVPGDSFSSAGFANAAPSQSNGNAVLVQTADAAGLVSDQSFHLIVAC